MSTIANKEQHNDNTTMDLVAMRFRQEAIIKELEYADSLSPEQYEEQGWQATGKLGSLAKEYAELTARLKGYFD